MRKLFSIGMALAVVTAMTVLAVPQQSAVQFVGHAQASDLGDNITSVLTEWLPLIILIAFVVALMAMLGMKRLIK